MDREYSTQDFIGKPKAKRPLGKLKCRLQNITKMDLTVI
jgi:hypothetical protein